MKQVLTVPNHTLRDNPKQKDDVSLSSCFIYVCVAHTLVCRYMYTHTHMRACRDKSKLSGLPLLLSTFPPRHRASY